jgi:hypothetical protein
MAASDITPVAAQIEVSSVFLIPSAGCGSGATGYGYKLKNESGGTLLLTGFTVSVGGEQCVCPGSVTSPAGWSGSQIGSTIVWTPFPSPYALADGASISSFNYTGLSICPPGGISYAVTYTTGSVVGNPPGTPFGAVPVELMSFSASQEKSSVKLSWATASETENLGFYIFRSESPDAGFQPLNNGEIVPGAINSSDQHNYSFVDDRVEVGKAYFYKLADVSLKGGLKFHGPIEITVGKLPTEYALNQNYPNPFNPETSISYQLKESGRVKLTIYNAVGQPVRALVDAEQNAGTHLVTWNGANDSGEKLGSGIYLYRLEVNGITETKKLVLSK